MYETQPLEQAHQGVSVRRHLELLEMALASDLVPWCQ
jgi:hypothetical protein